MIEKSIIFYESIEKESIKKLGDKNSKEIDLEKVREEFEEVCKKAKNEKLSKSKSLVGFVKTRNFLIEFHPKIWEDLNDDKKEIKNIVEFFKYAFLNEKLINESMSLRKLEKTDSIYQFFIRLYMLWLEKAIKEGFYFEYSERFDESNYSKARIELKKQINKLDKSKFSIDYYEYDTNNILNQNIKYANYYLVNEIEDFNLKKDLINIINQFPDEISNIYSWVDKDIIFSKLNGRFEIPYNYASNLVRNRSSFTEYGKRKYLWFLFDMNKVFENFVANFLEKNKDKIFENPSEVEILIQNGERNFIIEKNNNSKKSPLRSTIPDILIEYSDNKIIIDTKYKIINRKNDMDEKLLENNDEDENLTDNKSISNTDLYQIFTYSQIYGSENNILIYPSANKTSFSRPYYFLNNSNSKKFYYGFINLNFADNKGEKTIKEFKEFFKKIFGHNG